jgi:predicted nucleic acid-binding protein
LILLDANVLSELVKARPDTAVLAYIDRLAPDSLFTAAVCLAEMRHGLARMPRGRRHDDLAARIDTFLSTGFVDRVLPFDGPCAALYGDIRHAREAAGRPIAVEDAMIAATGRAFGVQAIATRNVQDFTACGVTIVDPWQTT